MAINKNAKIKTKIVHKKHTGKLLPHAHTSYGGLLLILFISLLPVVSLTKMTSADQITYPPPVSGDYQTFAVVPAPVPTTAPQITSLSDGQVFKTTDPVNVSGSCPNNTLIKIFKNNVMAGAVLCQNGSYKLQIDLFAGTNTLIARAYNTNDVPAPDSTPVTVTLEASAFNFGSNLPGSLGNPSNQFYITSDMYYRGASAGDSLNWPITIAGGQPPYALSIGWGDGKTDLLSEATAGTYNISHSYTQPSGKGGYPIFINATDQNGNKSYLQVVGIVSGHKAASLAIGGHTGSQFFTPIKGVEIIGVLTLTVVSFWIGEKRELRIIKHKTGLAV